MHRRIVNQNTDGASAIDESSDDEKFDPNYKPSNTESEFTDSEEDPSDEEEFIEHNISIASTSSTGSSCI